MALSIASDQWGKNMTTVIKGMVFGATLVCVVATAPVVAHHGTSVTYDTSRTITVSGTVTEWVFGFPHSQIYFDVLDASGTVTQWGSELAPTPSMLRNLNIGWTKDSIKRGDKMTLTCNPHKDPAATACLARQIVVNGKLLPLNAEQIEQANLANQASSAKKAEGTH
jgi:hypothetical protein